MADRSGADRLIAAVTEFIFVEDTPREADVIFLPGARKTGHALRAAELYRAGYAPSVVPSGRYSLKRGRFIGVPEEYQAEYGGEYETEWEFLRAVLMKNGVPASAILREDQATFTWENALRSKETCDRAGIALRRAILCVRPFHARRALTYYQAAMPETEFLVCPGGEAGLTRDTWFLTPEGRSRVFGEVARMGSQITPQAAMLLGNFAEKG